MTPDSHTLRRALAAVALATFAACAVADPKLPVEIAPGVVVARLAFGIISQDADGREKFVEAREVPATEGQVFGWLAEVRGEPRVVRWEERLTLPAKPASWGDVADDPGVTISADGRTATVRGEDALEEGVLSRFAWALTDGDPAGDYRLELSMGGRLVGRFTFHVAVPVRAGSIVVLRERPRTAG